MGLFDLPTHELELKIDGEWRSVLFADNLTDKELNRITDEWKQRHKVTGARYDGQPFYEDEEYDYVFFQPDPFPEPHVPLAPSSDAQWMSINPPDES